MFFINFFLKVIYLDFRDISGDEPFSIFHAQKELPGIIGMLQSENNPPLHFFLLHYWIKLFGISAFSVRFPSLVFSALTSVIVFKIGNKFFDLKTGITAALIFTFSTMHIYFSHEARVYPLFVLLTAWSLFLYLKIAEQPWQTKNYVLIFIADILLVYSHYFGFFVVFVQILGIFFVKDRIKILKRLALVFLALLIGYIPNIVVFTNRFLESKSGTWVAPPEIGQSYGFLNLFINGKYNMMILILVFISGGIILASQKKIFEKLKSFLQNVYFRTILLWFVIPYFTMFLVSYKLPMFMDRYILYTSIPFYLLIAVVLNHLTDKKIYAGMAVFAFIAGLIFMVSLNPDNNRRLKDAVQKVKELKAKDNVVLISPDYSDLGFTYYYNINYFKDYNNMKALLNKENIYPVNTVSEAEAGLREKNSEVIFLQAGNEFVDPDNLIYKTLANKYHKREQFYFFQIYYVHRFYN